MIYGHPVFPRFLKFLKKNKTQKIKISTFSQAIPYKFFLLKKLCSIFVEDCVIK